MVKRDILNGLKIALKKGETLEQAMMSFYFAGYDKKDIEDAAKEVNGLNIIPNTSSITQNKDINLKEKKNEIEPKNKNDKESLKAPENNQKFSKYEEDIKKDKLKKKRIILIISLIIVLLLLSGILILFFLK